MIRKELNGSYMQQQGEKETNKPKHSYMKFQIGHRLKGIRQTRCYRKDHREKSEQRFWQPSKHSNLLFFLIAYSLMGL